MGAELIQAERICAECRKTFYVIDSSLWVYKRYIDGKTYWYCRYSCMRAVEKRRTEKVRAKSPARKPTKDELEALLSGGEEIADISQMYGIHKTSVHYWIRKYGLQGVRERRKNKSEVMQGDEQGEEATTERNA